MTQPHITPCSTVTLEMVKAQLEHSQSSIPSSLDHLPSRLNFVGIITSYAEIQLVPWKKEVLMTIIDGSQPCSLKISMWVDHDNPIGIRSNTNIIGRFAYFKNVHLTSFDFTSPTELQFYGEMNPPNPFMHTILFPVISGGSYARYFHYQKPFVVDQIASLIPKTLLSKKAVTFFPLLSEDHQIMHKILPVYFRYVCCISKRISFGLELNPFQSFINSQQRLLQEPVLTHERPRRYKHNSWLTSYGQTIQWLSRQNAH